MPDQRYRFRLPDGQVFEAVGLAKIKRQYPDATIEGRVAFNERGEGTLVPYRGEQSEPPDEEDPPQDTNAPDGDDPYAGKSYTELKEIAEARDLKPGTSRESALAALLAADAAQGGDR